MSDTTSCWEINLELEKLPEATVRARVHVGVHLEEVISLFMIAMEADQDFVEKYCQDILNVGYGGGPFDEHPRNGESRKFGECSATLVAKALGIADDPAWQEIIDYARFTDTGKSRHQRPSAIERKHPAELNNLLKIRWRRLEAENCNGQIPKEKVERIIGIVFDFLKDLLFKQLEFVRACEIIKKLRATELTGFGGKRIILRDHKPVRVLMVQSDNYQVGAAARATIRPLPDFVIVRNSAGNVCIFTRNDRPAISMDDLALVVRIDELMRDETPRTIFWNDLRSEGKFDFERWYYHRPKRDNARIQMLLNGSEHHAALPTQISDERFLELLALALDREYFHYEHVVNCRQGICAGAECPVYRYGLPQCRAIHGK